MLDAELICDPLSENSTCLHFPRTSFYDFFCCLEGKTNGLLKFQFYLVRAFGVIAIDNRKSKTINLYSAYTGQALV